LGDEQGVRYRSRFCDRGAQFVLVDRRDVRLNGVGGRQLHDHLPALPGRRGRLVSVPTAIVVTLLGLFTLPHLGAAIHNLKPLSGGFLTNWNGFVGIVLALSGVEAIANATSVMKLNPGSSDDHPNVSKTSTPAIAWVMIEVCVLTALLGLGMQSS